MNNSLGNKMNSQSENSPLSNDWRFVKLAQVSYEATARNHDLHYSRDDVLGVNNESGLILSDRLLGEDFSRYKLLRKNQFAYNPMRLNVGSIGLWSNEEGKIVSPDYIVFGCKEDHIDPDYLDLFRQSAAWKQQIQQSGQGSVRIRYYYRHISEFLIPLPPLTEQKAIARVLRTVQQAKEATEKVIAATRQLKQSLMKHLFTYGPVPFDQADKVELKETEIGPLPSHWNTTPIVHLGEVVTGTTPSTKALEYYDGPFLFVSPGDMDENKFVEATIKRLSIKGLSVSRVLPPNSILVVCIGATIGKTAMTKEENTTTNQQINAVIPNRKKVIADFLYYAVTNRASRLPELASRAAIPIINKSNFSQFKIVLPPLPEQESISRMLTTLDDELRLERKRFTALGTLFGTLLENLMSGGIRLSGGPEIVRAEAV